MTKDVVFFLGALSFLSGVVYASFGLTLIGALVPAVLLFAILYATKADLRISLSAALLLILGTAYYVHDDMRYARAVAALPAHGTFAATVITDPKISGDAQTFTVTTEAGKIAVVTAPDPRYAYGDQLSITGTLLPASSYQTGQHVLASFRNPQITMQGENTSHLLRPLFALKHAAKDGYDRVLTPEKSAFLYAIVFGANDYVAPEFAEQLETSGLRFITAIDGLHMQIVIFIFFLALATLLSQRRALIATMILSLLYIALTGFTVSGIRASLMAGIATLARETHRMYLPHNALALVAVVLALLNPRTLVFDVGFQLSFLAVIAIIYLLPVVRALLHMSDAPGFLAWRESFLITLAVQIVTAPVVITQFQAFSLTSLIASVAFVWMLPLVLAGGLVLALVGFFYPLAYLVSFLVAPLITYAIFVVQLFATLAVFFNPPLGFVGIALYYSALVALVVWWYARPKKARAPVPQTAAARPLEISEEALRYEIIEIK